MADPRQRAAAPVERVEVAAYTIPTDRPESGRARPGPGAPGMGLSLRRAGAERFVV